MASCRSASDCCCCRCPSCSKGSSLGDSTSFWELSRSAAAPGASLASFRGGVAPSGLEVPDAVPMSGACIAGAGGTVQVGSSLRSRAITSGGGTGGNGAPSGRLARRAPFSAPAAPPALDFSVLGLTLVVALASAFGLASVFAWSSLGFASLLSASVFGFASVFEFRSVCVSASVLGSDVVPGLASELAVPPGTIAAANGPGVGGAWDTDGVGTGRPAAGCGSPGRGDGSAAGVAGE